MAGRGTDIKLGGNQEMIIEHELKGLQDEDQRKKKIVKIET